MFTNEFISLCKEFAGKREDVLDEIVDDSKKICKYRIVFYSHILEFRYVKKESVYYKPSSLYCVVGLKKNSVVYYHLTDIIPFVGNKTFKSCYFGNIESPQRLRSCFECLVSMFEDVFSQIAPFMTDDTLLRNGLYENYKTIFNLKDSDLDFEKIEDENEYAHTYFQSLQTFRDGWLFLRFSKHDAYVLLLKNRIDKAMAKYEKLNQKGKLIEYEKQLIDNIKKTKDSNFEAFDSCCDTFAASGYFMAFSSGLKAFIVVFALASLLLCGFFVIYNLIASHNTVVMLSAPWYLGFLCAAFCSISGAIAFFPYMPNQHLTKEDRRNYSKILISKNLKRASFILFACCVVASIFFATMMLISNVRFYDDNIKFSSSTYSYSQIDSIYYIDARYNVYGDRIERSSYVILFEDETSLDLDGYTSVNYTRKEVIPLLEEKTGFEVKKADSERQLPWYTVE